MKQIVFYRTRSGNCPVEDFLDSLTGKQAQKVIWVLRLIEDLDHVPRQYFKKLINTDDIWEVRIQFGGNIFRLLGFLDGDRLLILTSGFAKKTQKTPRQEIVTAEKRKRDYFIRRQNNE
jgi:phage-related protein